MLLLYYNIMSFWISSPTFLVIFYSYDNSIIYQRLKVKHVLHIKYFTNVVDFEKDGHGIGTVGEGDTEGVGGTDGAGTLMVWRA